MKITIGKYITWWGPYQIADLLQHVGFNEETTYRIGSILSRTKLNNLCEFLYDFRKRKIKVRIEDHDVWNADHTLSLIILPILKKIKESKHGTPYTYLEDAPQFPDDPHKKSNPEGFSIQRWEYILDEMIWTFEQIESSNENEPDCLNNFDQYVAYQERIKKGLMLFGKYYRDLWT